MVWQYVIIVAILLLVSLIVVKVNRKDFGSEVNRLVNYLGGKDNIVAAECNMSRFKVMLKDIKKVDKDGIQRLGAKGIVEVDNQLKIIFGRDSRALKKCIKDYL